MAREQKSSKGLALEGIRVVALEHPVVRAVRPRLQEPRVDADRLRVRLDRPIRVPCRREGLRQRDPHDRGARVARGRLPRVGEGGLSLASAQEEHRTVDQRLLLAGLDLILSWPCHGR
mgnify:CR=1 FL=1